MARSFFNAHTGTLVDKVDSAGDIERRGAIYVLQHSSQGIKKYRYLYNQHSASRAADLACYYDLTATTYPGLTVDQATTGNLDRLAGVHAETVASSAWGWVQVEGYCSSVSTRRYGSATNKNLTAGSYLGPGINAIDPIPSISSAEAEPDSGHNNANCIGYMVNVASAASHATQSSTVSSQACHIYGLVR